MNLNVFIENKLLDGEVFSLTSMKGVTFLAFGNGAPDIISSLAGIQQARPALVIGELFGKKIEVGLFLRINGAIYLLQLKMKGSFVTYS